MRLGRNKPVKFQPDKPSHRQVQASLVREKCPVYDAKGKIIRYRQVEVMKRQYVDDATLENRGISSELFSVDNQLAAGVSPAPFVGDFIKPSLEQKMQIASMTDDVVDVFEKIEKESLTEKQESND